MFGFHRDEFMGEDVRDDDGQKPAVSKKSWIALIVFCLICVLVIVESVFSQPEKREEAAHSTHTSSSVPRKYDSSQSVEGAGGVYSEETAQPLSYAEKLVSLTLSWRKDNGQVHSVSVDDLMKAGMSETLAHSYQPVWNTVFRETREAHLMVDPSTVHAQDLHVHGSPDRVIAVTAVLHPSWLASDDSVVDVDSNVVMFKVYWDAAQGKVVRFSEPDPQWLYFAVPEGARPPEVRPDGESD